MKGLIIIVTAFLVTPFAVAREQSKPQLARVTVYWASGGGGSDRLTRQHKAATGCRLRDGHCAVDPRHIPYGSKVVLADGSTLAAVDTGTAVRNRKAARKSGRTASERNAVVIDRFFETKSQALKWAKTHPLFMPIQVVAPNSRTPATLLAPSTPTINQTPLTAARATNPAAQPLVKKYPLLASTDTPVRSPLNRLGR